MVGEIAITLIVATHFSCLLGGKVIRVNGYLSLKAQCHSPVDLPILFSGSFPAGTSSSLNLVKQGAPS
jgi:hypothetical protein